MRRLFRQQQAVRMALQSCSLSRLQGVLFAAVRHKCLPVSVGYATVCKHSLVRVGDLVSHCDSGVLEAGMPVHSVELYPYGQTAFEQ